MKGLARLIEFKYIRAEINKENINSKIENHRITWKYHGRRFSKEEYETSKEI